MGVSAKQVKTKIKVKELLIDFNIFSEVSSTMTKTQNALKGGENLVAAVLRCLDKNIPVLMVWEFKGQLIHLGSSAMSGWFDSLDDALKEDLRMKMVGDVKNLMNGMEELLVNEEHISDKVKASCIYKSLTNPGHPSGIPLLPFPLEYMNKKEKAKYVCELIQSEATRKKIRLKYGEESCRPSFWLEEDWSWENLKESLFLVKEETYTGNGKWVEFLTKTIKSILDYKIRSHPTP